MDSAGPWLDRGHYLGFIILCVFSNCKLSQIKCIEFRNIEITECGCHSDPSDPHGIDVCPAPAAAMLPGPQDWFLPPTSPTSSPATQRTVPLPFGVQLPWQALETPSLWPPHVRGTGGGGTEVIPNTLPWSGVLLTAVLPPTQKSRFPYPECPGPPLGPDPPWPLSLTLPRSSPKI